MKRSKFLFTNASPILQEGKKVGLVEAQKHVGGYIEVVTLKTGELFIMCEDGIVETLPNNLEATEYFRENSHLMLSDGFIKGNVIICDPWCFD